MEVIVARFLKRILQKSIIAIVILSTSACVMLPYYGDGYVHSYSYVTPQPYWGYYNQPVVFSTPYYGYGSVYDPYYGISGVGNAVVQGLGWGLGLGVMHLLFGGHHH